MSYLPQRFHQREPSRRADAQTIADLNALESHVRFRAVVAQQTCGLGRKPQQRFDRFAGVAARAQLQYLTEQNKCRDHRRGVEVNAYRAAMAAERLRKGVGKKLAARL